MENFIEIKFDQDPFKKSRHANWMKNPPTPLGMELDELLNPSDRKPDRPNPPRPQGPFVLYRRNFNALMKRTPHYINFNETSTLAKFRWDNASEVEKEFFHMLADKAKEIHAGRYPNYKYQPTKSRGKNRFISEKPNNKKRRVRKNKKALDDNRIVEEPYPVVQTPVLNVSPNSATISSSSNSAAETPTMSPSSDVSVATPANSVTETPLLTPSIYVANFLSSEYDYNSLFDFPLYYGNYVDGTNCHSSPDVQGDW